MRPPDRFALLAALLLAGCAGAPSRPDQPAATVPVAASAPVAVPALGPTPDLQLPEQQKFTLPNGLAVRLVESRRLPIVAVHLVLL
jgi:hypothetical protein